MLSVLLATAALAHGLDMDQIAVDVNDDKALFTITPRASLFPSVDEDGDGELSVDEIRRRRDVIDATIGAGIVLTDQAGRSGTTYFSDVVLPHAFDDDAHRAGHLRIVRRVRFAEPVTAVTVDVSLFGPETASWTAHVRLGGETRSFRVQGPRERVVAELPASAVPPAAPMAAASALPSGLSWGRWVGVAVWFLVAGAGGLWMLRGAMAGSESEADPAR